MKSTNYVVAALILGLGVSVLAHVYVPGKKQSQPILLKGGDLYTVSDGVLPKTDLLFDNGRITQIGANLAAPANAQTIDVSGKRVYPGLIDGASGLGLVEIEAARATKDNAEVGRVHPEVQSLVAYNPDSELIPTVRANGVLLGVVAPEGGVISGRSALIKFDGWTREDCVEKADAALHLNWPSVAISTSSWVEKTAEEQKKEMAENREDLRKSFTTAKAYYVARKAGTQKEIDQRWEAMMPIFDQSMPVYVNANDARQIEQAVHFAKEHGIRIIVCGGREAYRVTDLLKANNIPVVLGRVQLLPYREDDDYDAPYKLPKLLHDAGIKFCLSYGYATWAARSLPFQASQAVAFGLDREAALRSLTLSAAEIIGVEKDLGSLTVGKKATLIVSDGDILDPITQRVTHAFIDGRAVDLNNRHKQLYDKYRQKSYPVD